MAKEVMRLNFWLKIFQIFFWV